MLRPRFVQLSRIAQAWLILPFAAAVMFGLAGCNSSEKSIMLSGAGSTFIFPVMGHWAEAFHAKHPTILINYQSIGSGGGIQQVRAGTVDFGATDVPLNDQELASMPSVLQIPESAGPVCITYNLSGLTEPLRFSPKTLAGIFLGRIVQWRDPAIEQENPGANLPNKQIVVVHRADGSGTTSAFTSYLAAISPAWSAKVGSGMSVSWPVGLGGKGSEGVTGEVKQSPGSIGYVELPFAVENRLPVASIENQAGQFIAPTISSAQSAIAAFQGALASDPRHPVVNPPAQAANAYPISTLTFLLVRRNGTNVARRSALREFIAYIVTDGQQEAAALHYAPLPQTLRQQNLQLLQQMTADGQPLR